MTFTSYAREGQLGRTIKTPDKATAKRKRDKEMITGMEKLKKRNLKVEQGFMKAMEAKLKKEAKQAKEMRDLEVKQKRQESNARLARWKEEADRAEYQAKNAGQAAKAVSKLLGDLAPVATKIATKMQEDREIAQSNEMKSILRQTGRTTTEINTLRQNILTEQEYNSEKSGIIKQMRDERNITYEQYNILMQKGGVYGRTFQMAHIVDKSDVNTYITANHDTTIGNSEYTWSDVLHGTLPGPERAALFQQGQAQFYSEAFGEDDASLVEEVAGARLRSQWNSLSASMRRTADVQARDTAKANDVAELKGKLNSYTGQDGLPVNNIGRAFALNFNTNLQGDKKLAINTLRNDTTNFVELIKTRQIDQVDIDALMASKVGPNGKSFLEQRPAEADQILDAWEEHQRGLNTKRNSALQTRRLDQIEESNAAIDGVLNLPVEEQQDAIDQLLQDKQTPPHVLQALEKLDNTLEASDRSRNKAAVEAIEDQRGRDNLPPTREMLDQVGITGEDRRRYLKEIKDFESEGEKERDAAAKGSFDVQAKDHYGTDYNYEKGNKNQKEVVRQMMLDYRRRKNAYRNTLSKEDAHQKAMSEVSESFKEGIDKDNPTGHYKYTIDEKDPSKTGFVNFGSDQSAPVKPSQLAKQYRALGENVVNVPESIFSIGEMSRWIKPHNIQQHEINRADEIAGLTSARDTATHVMIKQMEAANVPVPVWMADKGKAQTELIQKNYNNRKVIRQQALIGIDPEVLRTAANVNMQSIPGIARLIGPAELGYDDPDGNHSGGNAHFDVEFSSRELAVFVYDYLAARGITSTEHPDRGAGVTVPHARYPTSHYNGFKIDIGFGQTGSTGAIGTEADKAFAQRCVQLMREACNVYYNGVV